MHHTGKKESKKEILKNNNKENKVTKNLLPGKFEPGPSESVRTKGSRLYPLNHLCKR